MMRINKKGDDIGLTIVLVPLRWNVISNDVSRYIRECAARISYAQNVFFFFFNLYIARTVILTSSAYLFSLSLLFSIYFFLLEKSRRHG